MAPEIRSLLLSHVCWLLLSSSFAAKLLGHDYPEAAPHDLSKMAGKEKEEQLGCVLSVCSPCASEHHKGPGGSAPDVAPGTTPPKKKSWHWAWLQRKLAHDELRI